MELFKFIRLGIIFIGVGLSNCSTPGEYKIQGTATGIGQGMVCIISYLDKKADTLAKAEIKEEKFELKGTYQFQIPGVEVQDMAQRINRPNQPLDALVKRI